MYICQICKKIPATIHLTDIHDNVKKELHMCEGCAAEKGFDIQSASNLPQLLGMAAKKAAEAKGGVREAEEDIVCPRCGGKWSDFKARGRLGCPEDYRAFGVRMRTLVAGQIAPFNADADAFHIGKAPSGAKTAADPARAALRGLERRLRQAVAAEHYEEAAEIKGRIDAMRDGETA